MAETVNGKSPLDLMLTHKREHEELTRQQRERDGKIWDGILNQWTFSSATPQPANAELCKVPK